MPRDSLSQVRKDRNAALLDAMVLAASADGKIAATELKQVLTRIIERPEFEGVQAQELSSMVELSAKRLSHARTLEEIIHGLKDRNLAVLLISHSLDQVFRLSDRICVLRRGVQVGIRRTAETSANEIVAMITGVAQAAR